jgi:hypothetical protein
MRQLIVSILSLLALLVCVVTIVFWVRSYFRNDCLGYQWANVNSYRYARSSLETARGGVILTYHFGQTNTPHSNPPAGFFFVINPLQRFPLSRVQWGGFGYQHQVSQTSEWGYSSLTRITAPLWLVILLSAILPLRWGWLKWRSYCIKRIGLCRSCGYDMRGTPERCPECGTVPKQLGNFGK